MSSISSSLSEYWILPLTRAFSQKGRKQGSEQPKAEGEMGPTCLFLCERSDNTAITLQEGRHYHFLCPLPKVFQQKTVLHSWGCLSTEWIDASVCCFEVQCRKHKLTAHSALWVAYWRHLHGISFGGTSVQDHLGVFRSQWPQTCLSHTIMSCPFHHQKRESKLPNIWRLK